MVIRKTMTNVEIYTHANNLLKAFENIAEQRLPVKVHFYFQKNMNVLVDMARELEKSRTEILERYGVMDEETGNYKFENEKVDLVNGDINDLFSLEQEVKLHTFPIDWLDGVELTAQQVNAFTFMIDEEEE